MGTWARYRQRSLCVWPRLPSHRTLGNTPPPPAALPGRTFRVRSPPWRAQQQVKGRLRSLPAARYVAWGRPPHYLAPQFLRLQNGDSVHASCRVVRIHTHPFTEPAEWQAQARCSGSAGFSARPRRRTAAPHPSRPWGLLLSLLEVQDQPQPGPMGAKQAVPLAQESSRRQLTRDWVLPQRRGGGWGALGCADCW